MNFGDALAHARNGQPICRSGWNGRDMYVYLHHLAPYVEPFLALHAADGKDYAWVTSQADVLAEDWEVISTL